VRHAVRERLAGQLRRMHAFLTGPETFWRRGLAHEIGWWERWIVQKGRRWPDDFRDRLDSKTPLREELIVDLLPSIAHDPVRVLDVGAGPATSLGKVHPERALEIVAVDPLADEYATLWRDAGIRPPVPTERGTGERLVERFGTAAFDIAYARNALDHMIDPLAVVEQMLAVVADGGYVVLRHSQNEATKARYRGLHQWNIALEGSDLVVRRPRHRINLSAELAGRAVVTCRQNDEAVTCVISKRSAAKRAPHAPADSKKESVERTANPRRRDESPRLDSAPAQE
jgi:SAM-dependent methyltransferase